MLQAFDEDGVLMCQSDLSQVPVDLSMVAAFFTRNDPEADTFILSLDRTIETTIQ